MCIAASVMRVYVCRVCVGVSVAVAETVVAAEHASRVHIHPRRMETNNAVRCRWALKKTNFIRTSRTYIHIILCACARAHGDSSIRYGFVYIEPPAGRPRADGPPNRI